MCGEPGFLLRAFSNTILKIFSISCLPLARYGNFAEGGKKAVASSAKQASNTGQFSPLNASTKVFIATTRERESAALPAVCPAAFNDSNKKVK